MAQEGRMDRTHPLSGGFALLLARTALSLLRVTAALVLLAPVLFGVWLLAR
jgi:hypothetical protein